MTNIILSNDKNVSSINWGFLTANVLFGQLTVDNMLKISHNVILQNGISYLNLNITHLDRQETTILFEIPAAHNVQAKTIEYAGDSVLEVWAFVTSSKNEHELHDEFEKLKRKIPQSNIQILC